MAGNIRREYARSNRGTEPRSLLARLRLSRDSREEVDRSGRELLKKSYYELDTINPIYKLKELIIPSE